MFDISLIIPTFGRFEEVRNLMESITEQNYNLSRVEVILVDQNDVIDLLPIIREFSDRLTIVHIKSQIKGISHSKNLGMQSARAVIVTFPDDDCTYYPDTVSSALNIMAANPNWDVVYGRLYDIQRKKNIMRNWSDTEKRLNIYNFHVHYSAPTCFTRNKDIYFDERFGVGSAYGMGEELDYMLHLFKIGAKVYYTPAINIWHPELNVGVMQEIKVRYYARGYGATFRKNLGLRSLVMFTVSLAYMLMAMLLAFARGNREMAYKRWLGLTGRIEGFVTFLRT